VASLSAREIDCAGRFGLHAKGEFVAGDARLEFALRAGGGVGAVHLREEVELAALLGVAHAFGRVEVGDRVAAGGKARALIDGGT